MKAKTIKKIIKSKLNFWFRSIEDENIRKIAQENTIVTGGCIVSMLLNEEVSDYDIYFRTPEAAFKIAEYYVARFAENPSPTFKHGRDIKISAKLEPEVKEGQTDHTRIGIQVGPLPPRVRIIVKSAGMATEDEQKEYQYFEGINDPTEQAELVDAYINATSELDEIKSEELDVKDHDKNATKKAFRPIFLTSNAITLADEVQLIIRFQGEPEEIHKNYDFVHCTNYYTSWDDEIVLQKDALECILNKELKYIGSKYPLCSVIRTRKFITRGWTINAGQYVKMCWQISQLDLSDINVLEDQLVGVDSAYFHQIIQGLKEKQEENAKGGLTTDVDGTYLMTLVDKIFN